MLLIGPAIRHSHWAVSGNKDKELTQLHKACLENDETKVLRLVCTNEHEINVQDNADYTALHWACYFGYSDIVKSLMLAGADEQITNMSKETPAQVAKKRGHNELLKFLDKVSLLEALQRTKLNKLLATFLTILTIHLVRQKVTKRKWYSVLLATYVVLIISKHHLRDSHSLKKAKRKCVI